MLNLCLCQIDLASDELKQKKPSTWLYKQLLGKPFYVFTQVWVPYCFGFLDKTQVLL